MSAKSTALLLAAAALLFAFVCLVERPLRQAALIPPDLRMLPNLDPAKITSVEIHAPGGEIIFAAKTNQSWQLTKPISYPAASVLVDTLLEQLARWQWRSSIGSDELTNHPDAEVEFGFVPPQFTLVLQEDGRQRTLYVGHLSALGDEVYLKMKGGYQIYIADADPLKWIPTDKDQWRDRTVMDVAQTPFQRIEVRSTNSTFDHALTFDLDPATRLWGITLPFKARADTPKITNLLAQLQNLRAQAFVPDDPQALEAAGLQGPTTPQLILTFLRDNTGTNTAFELQMGASPTNQTNLAYARRQSPANLIEVPKAPLAPWEESYTNFLDLHLTSLSPALLTSIHVIGVAVADEFTVQKGANGAWSVSGRDETFPADEFLMKDWLAALTNLVVEVEQLNMADVAIYGLDTPLLRYQLHYLETGGQSRPLTNELRFGTNGAGKVFERFEGYQSVNALPSDDFNRLPRYGWELRDRAIFHFESNEVAAIAVHQQGADCRYIRDAQNQWILAPGSSGSTSPLTSIGLNEALYRMGRLQAVYWIGVGEDHLEQFRFDETDYQLSFELKRGARMETNTIHFGKASPYLHPYAFVMRDGRRLVFEFGADFYNGLVAEYLSIPAAYRPPR
jgi:hypothetical protein